MKDTIKLMSVFDIDEFRMIPDNSTLTKTEKEILILNRNENNKLKYEKFDTDFMIYLMKLPNSPAKKYVERLFNNKLIYIGTDNKKDSTLGGIAISTDNKLALVSLDAVDLEISMITGETSNIDLCVYASYFNFIRGVVLIYRKEIKKNKVLNDLLIQYLKNILRKSTSSAVLNPKQELLFDAVVRQFYYQFFLHYDFNFALDFTLNDVRLDMKSEVESIFGNIGFGRYKQFRDIFKALFDMKIIMESPNKLLMDALNKLGMSQFLFISTVIDYLIASVILSNYPGFSFTKNLSTSKELQTKIEGIINGYADNISFSLDYIKGL